MRSFLGGRVLFVVLTLAGATAAGAGSLAVVACAPGYPGSTVEAQPTMDAFAKALATAAGMRTDAVSAAYYETEAAGVERLRRADAALALVPLPFYLLHRGDLGLTARLTIVQQGGTPAEPWSLVAAKGRLHAAEDLDGWQLLSIAAYAPRFVRGVALGAWGAVPASTRLLPAGSVLSALRRAAATENVALLLDPEQARALPSLPFAGQLQVVTSSRPLPGSLLCTVGKRQPDARLRPLLSALDGLASKPAGAAALAGLRIVRFGALDAATLATAERAYEAAKP